MTRLSGHDRLDKLQHKQRRNKLSKRQMPKVRNPRMNKTMEYRRGAGDFPTISKPKYNRKMKYIRKES